MEFIPLELSGALTDEVREKYGGGFTFWENLKMGGTGSHKLLFLTGPQEIHDFDNSSVETLQVSFQYLKQAFLLRFNVARKISGWIVRYDEVDKIELYRIVVPNEDDPEKQEIQYRCRLQLINTANLTLRLHKSDRKHFYRYFSKGPLQDRLAIGDYFFPATPP